MFLLAAGCMKGQVRPEFFTYLATSTIDELKTLDPSQVRVIAEYHLIHNLTAQLIGFEKNGQYAPRLAEKVELSDDRKTVRIVLSQRTFSNGDPITSKDLEATLKRLLLKGSPHTTPREFIRGAASVRTMSDDCPGIRLIDAKTLVVELTHPVKDLLYYLQLGDYGILHRSQYEAGRDLTPDDWKVTSGPYRIEIDPKGERYLQWNDSYGPKERQIQKLKAVTSHDPKSLVAALNRRDIQIGTIGFRDYFDSMQDPNALEHIEMVGSKHTGVAVLLLNAAHPKFKALETRRWILKRVIDGLEPPARYGALLEKAYEYFLPGAPGFLQPEQVTAITSKFNDAAPPPKAIHNEINVWSSPKLEAYVPSELRDQLAETLGIEVKFRHDIPREAEKARTFEAMLLIVSMSYKVLGESLTLNYKAEPPLFLDPSGRVRKSLDVFHHSTTSSGETAAIRDILTAMTEDAEVVPLFYCGYMKFYDKDLLDASDVSFFESFEIANYRVR